MAPPLTTSPERLAELGLLGTWTLFVRRRAGRGEPVASGPAGGGYRLSSEQFGWVAALPAGWSKQSGDALLVESYGLVVFQELTVLTPSSAVVRLACATEPARPTDGALEEVAALVVRESEGELVARGEAPVDTFEGVDLLLRALDGAHIRARVGIAGRRVICVEGRGSTEEEDAIVRGFLDGFHLLRGEPWDARTSGTFRTPAARAD